MILNFSSVGLQTTQIWINHLIPIFATRKAVAPFSNIQSCWADQYGSIDTWNIKICPLVIILWQNILGHQQVALNSLLTTLPNRNFYRKHHGGLILCWSMIRKNTTRRKTDRQRTEKKQWSQLQRPLYSPMDRTNKNTNIQVHIGSSTVQYNTCMTV